MVHTPDTDKLFSNERVMQWKKVVLGVKRQYNIYYVRCSKSKISSGLATWNNILQY